MTKVSFAAYQGVSTNASTLKTAYQNMVTAGDIVEDPRQTEAVDKLQSLIDALNGYTGQMGKSGWRVRMGLGAKIKPTPRGLYLWGGVGRGKSMLMDLFFEHVPTDKRKHVHFHGFMQEVHRRLQNFQNAQRQQQAPVNADPIVALARVISDQAWLLCFDEFHVSDIGDAMILGRLFEQLFENGVVVVTTSNRPPWDLYKDGLQRERFMPFIKLIEEKLCVFELDAGRDYRLERLHQMDAYLTPLSRDASAKLKKDFHELTLGAVAKSVTLRVQGRDVIIPLAAEGVAYVEFSDLCAKALGAGDYLMLAETFHTLILDKVPGLGPENRNEAKRFIILIDALYEAKTNLIIACDAPPAEIYDKGDGAFEFERTVSRLMEMQSADYQSLAHQKTEKN